MTIEPDLMCDGVDLYTIRTSLLSSTTVSGPRTAFFFCGVSLFLMFSGCVFIALAFLYASDVDIKDRIFVIQSSLQQSCNVS